MYRIQPWTQEIVRNINEQLTLARSVSTILPLTFIVIFSLIGGGVKVQYCIRLLSLGYQNIQEEKAGHSDHSPTRLNEVKYPGLSL